MKTTIYFRSVFVIFCVCLWTGCDNDTPYYGDAYSSSLNLLYSNKSATQPNAGILTLNYSGSPAYGRDVYFEMTDASHARIKLFGVLPTEEETGIESVPLTKTKDGYEFSTSGTSAKGTTFTLSGSVKEGELVIELSDVKIPSNPLSDHSPFPTRKTTNDYNPIFNNDTSDPNHFYFETIYEYYTTTNSLLDWQIRLSEEEEEENLLNIGGDLTEMAQALLSSFLFLLVEEFQFHPDGNIIAKYAALPENLNIMSVLMGVDASMRSDVKTSPANLCYYFVENDVVYIQLNIEMVLRTIQENQTKASTKAIDLNTILGLYPLLNRWMNEGIIFRLETNDPDTPREVTTTNVSEGPPRITSIVTMRYYNDARYFLYPQQDELLPLIELLPGIVELLLGDTDLTVDTGILGVLDLKPMIEELLERMSKTTNCRLALAF